MTQRTAGIALLIGGAMWGLYWIPVRFLVNQGLTGPWPGIVMFASAMLALVPFVWADRHRLVTGWRALIFSGMFTGAAFSLFTTSLVYTEVAHAILLFYLTPIWGTMLGVAFLGERIGPARLIGLICGLGGLLVVLGGEQNVPWPQNAGDWLALLSGMTWALGSLGLYRTGGATVPGQVFAFVAGALVISVASLALTLPAGGGDLGPGALRAALPFALVSAIYMLPMLFLTIWPATRLPPAKVGLLLMSEIVVGLVTAAIFSGDTFGLRELAGATLIVSAAVLEIWKT